MRIVDTHNENETTTVVLAVGDDVSAVPESHCDLLTPDILAAFADVEGWLRRVIADATVPNMRTWFEKVLNGGRWELWLEVGEPSDVMLRAGFRLDEPTIRPATVGVPTRARHLWPMPKSLAEFYHQVGFVDWQSSLMLSGGLGEAIRPPSLEVFKYTGSAVDAVTTRVIGWSRFGDMLIATEDDRGGWYSHETGEVALVGSTAGLLEWVFGELLAKREPTFGG